MMLRAARLSPTANGNARRSSATNATSEPSVPIAMPTVARAIPATFFGFAKIGVAIALHEGSTLLVVANALRLLAYRDRRTS